VLTHCLMRADSSGPRGLGLWQVLTVCLLWAGGFPNLGGSNLTVLEAGKRCTNRMCGISARSAPTYGCLHRVGARSACIGHRCIPLLRLCRCPTNYPRAAHEQSCHSHSVLVTGLCFAIELLCGRQAWNATSFNLRDSVSRVEECAGLSEYGACAELNASRCGLEDSFPEDWLAQASGVMAIRAMRPSRSVYWPCRWRTSSSPALSDWPMKLAISALAVRLS